MSSFNNYQSLFNQLTGTFDDAYIDNAFINNAEITTETVGNSKITNAIISNETVGTSTINNLTIGNVLYFPDGTVSLPSIAFANEHSTGLYRVGTNQMV